MHARVFLFAIKQLWCAALGWHRGQSVMNFPGHRDVADKWGWRALAPWIVPMCLFPVLLIFLVSLYVFVKDWY